MTLHASSVLETNMDSEKSKGIEGIPINSPVTVNPNPVRVPEGWFGGNHGMSCYDPDRGPSRKELDTTRKKIMNRTNFVAKPSINEYNDLLRRPNETSGNYYLPYTINGSVKKINGCSFH